MLWDWGMPIEADLFADASAALGIIGRSGLGKLRHIDTSYLWLQQESIRKKLKLDKVLGTENPADMNTKGLNAESIEKYVRMLNMEHKEGRAELAPELHQGLHKANCSRYNSTNKNITKRVRRKPKAESQKQKAKSGKPKLESQKRKAKHGIILARITLFLCEKQGKAGKNKPTTCKSAKSFLPALPCFSFKKQGNACMYVCIYTLRSTAEPLS